ncbi:MAG: acyltransferase [Nitrospira sp.]|nr:acyltransferase [Nitrospira sp.]
MNEEHQRIEFLDHLRGVAIAMVFCLHVFGETFASDSPQWGRWFVDIVHNGISYFLLFPFTYGWVGVAIFFVLSGFCIHLSYERDQTRDFHRFFFRRFFRIYPPYCIAVVLFTFVITPYPAPATTRDLVTHVLLINNLDEASFFSLNPSFWTIAVEVQLYALYPLLVLMAQRFGWASSLWLAGSVALAIKAYSVLQGYFEGTMLPLPSWLWHSPLRYWFAWTLGAKLADDFLQGRRSVLSRCPMWVWPSLTILSGILKPLAPFTWEFAALATGTVIAHLLVRPLSQTFLSHFVVRHMRTVGLASYSMYLVHQPILSWLRRQAFPAVFGSDMHPFMIVLLCMGAWLPILSLAWLLYRFIEIPSISLGKQFLRHRQAGRSVVPGLG